MIKRQLKRFEENPLRYENWCELLGNEFRQAVYRAILSNRAPDVHLMGALRSISYDDAFSEEEQRLAVDAEREVAKYGELSVDTPIFPVLRRQLREMTQDRELLSRQAESVAAALRARVPQPEWLEGYRSMQLKQLEDELRKFRPCDEETVCNVLRYTKSIPDALVSEESLRALHRFFSLVFSAGLAAAGGWMPEPFPAPEWVDDLIKASVLNNPSAREEFYALDLAHRNGDPVEIASRCVQLARQLQAVESGHLAYRILRAADLSQGPMLDRHLFIRELPLLLDALAESGEADPQFLADTRELIDAVKSVGTDPMWLQDRCEGCWKHAWLWSFEGFPPKDLDATDNASKAELPGVGHGLGIAPSTDPFF